MVRFKETHNEHPVAYLLGSTSDTAFRQFASHAPSPEEAIRGWAQIREALDGEIAKSAVKYIKSLPLVEPSSPLDEALDITDRMRDNPD